MWLWYGLFSQPNCVNWVMTIAIFILKLLISVNLTWCLFCWCCFLSLFLNCMISARREKRRRKWHPYVGSGYFYFSSNSSLAILVMKWNSDTWRNFTSGSAQMFVKLNTNYAQKMGGFNNHALSWILQKKPNLTCFCCKIFQMHTFLQC